MENQKNQKKQRLRGNGAVGRGREYFLVIFVFFLFFWNFQPTVQWFCKFAAKTIGLSALFEIRYAKSLDCRLFLASDIQIHWTVGSFGIKNAYSTSKIKDFQLKVLTVQAKSMIFGQTCLQHKQNQWFSAKSANSASEINDLACTVGTFNWKSLILLVL